MPPEDNQQTQNQNSEPQQTSSNEPQFKGMDGRNITTQDTVPATSDEDLKAALGALLGNIQPTTEGQKSDQTTVTANAGMEANITTPYADKNQQPQTTEPPIQTEEQTTQAEEKDTILSLIQKFLGSTSTEQQTTEQNQQTSPLDQQQTQEQQQQIPATSFEEKEKAYITRIQELENQLVAWEEFKKNPGEFLSRNFPAFMKTSFDPLVYVSKKMEEKWGSFKPDPVEALTIGTPSWSYVQDQQMFLQEAQSMVTTAETQERQLVEEGEKRFREAKERVKAKYNMTEDDFQNMVWTKLERMDNGQALELLSDAIMAIEELKKVKENIKKQSDRSKVPPSVADISTSKNVVADEELKKLITLFPSRFGL